MKKAAKRGAVVEHQSVEDVVALKAHFEPRKGCFGKQTVFRVA